VLSRRHLLLAATATLAGCATAEPLPATVAAAPPPPAPPPATPEQQLASFMDDVFQQSLNESPQLVTQLGLDKDARAAAKARLDNASPGEIARQKRLTGERLARLKTIDRSRLTGMSAVNYDMLHDAFAVNDEGNRRFDYGYPGAGQPYVLSQLTGSYQQIPDFLGTQHTIETKSDADAYLHRLDSFGDVMDQELERAKLDAARGVIPPDFVLERSLTQMKGLIEPPEASPLVRSVADRAKQKGIEGGYEAQAAALYRTKVVPALQRQIAHMQSLQPKAVHDAGCWRLPDGEAYYGVALRGSTTTTLSPDEIHEMGLDQARQLSARADVLLKKAGYSRGTVGQRIQQLFKEKKYHYANTDLGKEKLIADLNKQVAAMSAKLPQMFGALPKAPVEVRRVPKFIEAGAPGGYYNQPSLDGTRPGIYWINLRDTAENPTWTLPTLTYHEAVPGHHNQLALQQEADLPMLRRILFNSAYAEGWALYAEQLAQEMGVYENDPLGEVGYLQSSLFRAGRLVVDTGMHYKRWSREKAIDTMTSIDGSPRSAATTEIERYCVWPGQACSYMVGKLTWVRLRDKARAALGPRFDYRKFHDAGLLTGSVPMTVLENVIDTYIAQNRA
jgi:uncharacterized protein (DUF885 family)